MAVTPKTASIPVGSTQQFTATGTYSDGSAEDLSTSVIWTSSDTTLATIDSAGLASGVKVGNVTIMASKGDLSDSAILDVTLHPELDKQPMDFCFTCHGSYSALIELTVASVAFGEGINPHDTHQGELEC